MPPTIIDNPPQGSRIISDGSFQPIVPVLEWSSEEDVIKCECNKAKARSLDLEQRRTPRSEDVGVEV